MDQKTLSVCLITYNHVNYIREAIDGVLMQNVNFTWELLIADDFSTDGTRDILLQYKDKYPDFINLIFQQKNVGPFQNWIDLITAPSSKYIAYFEGDDYWTDPFKLQKQVDYLESNNGLSFCCHNAVVHYVDKDSCADFNSNLRTGRYKTKDLLIKGWFIPSASLLIRKKMLPDPFPEWYNKVHSGDYAIELLLSTKGDFFYLDEKMSVYRKNVNNSMSVSGPSDIESLKRQIFLLNSFRNSSGGKYLFFIYYAMLKRSFIHFRGYIYMKFPVIANLKNKLLLLARS
jgi:glycosyltransferase involved in cell wall biosynthesis